MSPPPGNRGGAVSGAGPCALATEAQSSERNDKATRANRPMKYEFRVLTNISSSRNGYAEAHECIRSGSRLEDLLDTKRQRGRSAEDGRSVAVCCDYATREIETLGGAGRWQYRGYKNRVGNAMHGRRLRKRSVYRLHGLATILSVMTVRRARRHRIAALHRLLRRRSIAVECIRHEGNCQHRQRK
jgi:hypothetical protein